MYMLACTVDDGDDEDHAALNPRPMPSHFAVITTRKRVLDWQHLLLRARLALKAGLAAVVSKGR